MSGYFYREGVYRPSVVTTNLFARVLVIALLLFNMPIESGESTNICSVKGDSGRIVLLLCEKDVADENVVESAKQACADRSYCNAWVWTDEKYIPENAPQEDSQLPQDLIMHAIAVLG